jgi:membrane protein required for colicin V production
MHWFDIGIVIALILSGVWSCFRGLVREVLSLAGLLAASALAVRYAPNAAQYLTTFIATPSVRHAAGFALIFLAVMVVVMVCSLLLRLMLRAVGLSPLDRLLGGLFGLAKVALVVSVFLLMANKFFPAIRAQLEADSVLAPYCFQSAAFLATVLEQHDDVIQQLQQRFR